MLRKLAFQNIALTILSNVLYHNPNVDQIIRNNRPEYLIVNINDTDPDSDGYLYPYVSISTIQITVSLIIHLPEGISIHFNDSTISLMFD